MSAKCSEIFRYFYCKQSSHTAKGNSFLLFFADGELKNKTNKISKCVSFWLSQWVPCDIRANRATVLCIFQNVCDRTAENHLCSRRNEHEFMRINTNIPCDKKQFDSIIANYNLHKSISDTSTPTEKTHEPLFACERELLWNSIRCWDCEYCCVRRCRCRKERNEKYMIKCIKQDQWWRGNFWNILSILSRAHLFCCDNKTICRLDNSEIGKCIQLQNFQFFMLLGETRLLFGVRFMSECALSLKCHVQAFALSNGNGQTMRCALCTLSQLLLK